MQRILNSKEMKNMDTQTIKELGIPSRILMETAGAHCAEAIIHNCQQHLDMNTLILCGSGNNGGDGYVIARNLLSFGINVLIMSLANGKMSEETRLNRELCEKLEIPILEVFDDDSAEKALWQLTGSISLIVDAVFGIGFKGILPKHISYLFSVLNTLQACKVAIDIPSGLCADTGNGECLKMDYTIVIEELKYGHLLQNGRLNCGELLMVPIGIPVQYKSRVKSFLYSDLDLPQRPVDAHKGTFGRVVIFGGSLGYTGSARLAALSALRGGAGLVYLYTRKEILPYYADKADEIMNFAIPEDAKGLPDEAVIMEILAKADAICIGCGMGLDEYALRLLQIVLKHSKKPTVIDADAITLLAQNPGFPDGAHKRKMVLTPHKAEFCRIAGISLKKLDADLISAVSKLQSTLGCSIFLKGHSSIYVSKEETHIVCAGNDALATGGSGDILAGLIASFAAQGAFLSHAVCTASLLIGKTAVKLCETRSSFTVLPTDIIEHIGDRYE